MVAQRHDLMNECDAPRCTREGDRSWSGEQNNSVNVCNRHYWKLVTGQLTPATSLSLSASDPSTAPGQFPRQSLGQCETEFELAGDVATQLSAAVGVPVSPTQIEIRPQDIEESE